MIREKASKDAPTRFKTSKQSYLVSVEYRIKIKIVSSIPSRAIWSERKENKKQRNRKQEEYSWSWLPSFLTILGWHKVAIKVL